MAVNQRNQGLASRRVPDSSTSAQPVYIRASALVGAARGNWIQVGLPPNPTAGYEGKHRQQASDQATVHFEPRGERDEASLGVRRGRILLERASELFQPSVQEACHRGVAPLKMRTKFRECPALQMMQRYCLPLVFGEFQQGTRQAQELFNTCCLFAGRCLIGGEPSFGA